MTRREQDAFVRDWTVGFGRTVLAAYLISAVDFDWRPADVLELRLPHVVCITLNMLALWIAYRSARRAGTRFGRWRLAAAGCAPGTLPN